MTSGESIHTEQLVEERVDPRSAARRRDPDGYALFAQLVEQAEHPSAGRDEGCGDHVREVARLLAVQLSHESADLYRID